MDKCNWMIEGLHMDKSQHGWGVFTKNPIKNGELIERCIMSVLKNVDGNENPHLFTWSDDKKTWAAGTGLLPFYNHSDTPNIIKKADFPNNILEVYALRDIDAGEELRNTYYSKQWRTCFQTF